MPERENIPVWGKVQLILFDQKQFSSLILPRVAYEMEQGSTVFIHIALQTQPWHAIAFPGLYNLPCLSCNVLAPVFMVLFFMSIGLTFQQEVGIVG